MRWILLSTVLIVVLPFAAATAPSATSTPGPESPACFSAGATGQTGSGSVVYAGSYMDGSHCTFLFTASPGHVASVSFTGPFIPGYALNFLFISGDSGNIGDLQVLISTETDAAGEFAQLAPHGKFRLGRKCVRPAARWVQLRRSSYIRTRGFYWFGWLNITARAAAAAGGQRAGW